MVSWYGVMKELVFLKFKKKSLRAISSARYDAHKEPLFKNCTLLKIEDIHKVQQLQFFHKLTHKDLPAYFTGMDKTCVYTSFYGFICVALCPG